MCNFITMAGCCCEQLNVRLGGECLYIWSWQINSGHLCVTLAQYLLSVINSVWLYRMRHITWFSATNLPRWYPVREQEFQVSLSHMNREGLKQIYMWRELPNQPIELSTDKLSRSTHEHVTWPFFPVINENETCPKYRLIYPWPGATHKCIRLPLRNWENQHSRENTLAGKGQARLWEGPNRSSDVVQRGLILRLTYIFTSCEINHSH